MKKIFISALVIYICGAVYADIDLRPKNSSDASVWYGLIIPVVASAQVSETSSNASAASSKSNENQIDAVYDYYKQLAQNEIILAEEVFSEQDLITYGLKNNDVVKLDETNIGLLVSYNGKGIGLIPSKISNAGLVERADR